MRLSGILGLTAILLALRVQAAADDTTCARVALALALAGSPPAISTPAACPCGPNCPCRAGECGAADCPSLSPSTTPAPPWLDTGCPAQR